VIWCKRASCASGWEHRLSSWEHRSLVQVGGMMQLEAGGLMTLFPVEGRGISVVCRCEAVFGVMFVQWL